jgi:hypothetical protein
VISTSSSMLLSIMINKGFGRVGVPSSGITSWSWTSHRCDNCVADRFAANPIPRITGTSKDPATPLPFGTGTIHLGYMMTWEGRDGAIRQFGRWMRCFVVVLLATTESNSVTKRLVLQDRLTSRPMPGRRMVGSGLEL